MEPVHEREYNRDAPEPWSPPVARVSPDRSGGPSPPTPERSVRPSPTTYAEKQWRQLQAKMKNVSSVVKKQFVNPGMFVEAGEDREEEGRGVGFKGQEGPPRVTWKRPGHMQYVESLKATAPVNEIPQRPGATPVGFAQRSPLAASVARGRAASPSPFTRKARPSPSAVLPTAATPLSARRPKMRAPPPPSS